MFGIGLPELILIMVVALIVVGPDRLPDLAKTLARQAVELKRAANALKDSFNEEDELKPWEKDHLEIPHMGSAEKLDLLRSYKPDNQIDAEAVIEPDDGNEGYENEGEEGGLADKVAPSPPSSGHESKLDKSKENLS